MVGIIEILEVRLKILIFFSKKKKKLIQNKNIYEFKAWYHCRA